MHRSRSVQPSDRFFDPRSLAGFEVELDGVVCSPPTVTRPSHHRQDRRFTMVRRRRSLQSAQALGMGQGTERLGVKAGGGGMSSTFIRLEGGHKSSRPTPRPTTSLATRTADDHPVRRRRKRLRRRLETRGMEAEADLRLAALVGSRSHQDRQAGVPRHHRKVLPPPRH